MVNAVTVASGSNHPLSVAICEEAAKKAIPIPSAINVQTVAGRGLRVEREEGTLLLGSRLFLEEQGVTVPNDSHLDSEALLANSGQYQGAFRFSDPLRAEAAAAIAELHDQGIKTALLTGDRLQPALQVASQAALGEILAELRPEQKADWVKERQAEGSTVIMVGDGINDAPALSQADVGCAMAGGTDIALETSDLVLTRPDLKRLLQALFIARKGLSTIRQNLFWAFSYNLVAIPLAASGLLAPVWAAAAMALSSILVIGNSLILGKRLKKRVAISNTHN